MKKYPKVLYTTAAGYRPDSGNKGPIVLPAKGTIAIYQHIQRIIFTNPCLAVQLCRFIILKKVAYCTGTRCFSLLLFFFLPLFHPSGVIYGLTVIFL
jgi:hypothetical protein